MGVGGTSSGPGVRSGSSGDDYRTAGKMRGTRTRARRGRAQIATNSESQAISSHPQPHAHGTAMGTPPVRRRGPTPRPPLSPAHPGASRRHTHSVASHCDLGHLRSCGCCVVVTLCCVAGCHVVL